MDYGKAAYDLASKAITPDRTNFISVNRNLFNPDTKTTDYFINKGNGALVSYAGYTTTDFIPVLPNTSYTTSINHNVVFFDANKTFIYGMSPNGAFTTPSNCYYIRADFLTSTLSSYQVGSYQIGAAYVANFDETLDRLLLPPKMYFSKGNPLPIYKSSFIASNNALEKFKTSVNSVDATTGIPRYRYFVEDMLLDPDTLASTFKIGVKQDQNPDNFYYGDIAKVFIDPATKTAVTPKVLCIGDSLTDRFIPAFLKQRLGNFSVTATMIGTMANQGGEKGEGRGGWTFSNFVGKDNTNYGTAITLATSGATATLQNQNPFLKLADATDKANHPDWCFRNTGVDGQLSYTQDTDKTGNFYIFDFAYYLSNHVVANPDVITIALSTNDIGRFPSSSIATCRLSLEIMIKQIKAALPNVVIGIIPSPAWSSIGWGNTNWTTYVSSWIENCMTDVKAFQATFTNLHIVPIWMHMNKEWIFPMTPATLSTINQTQKATISDNVHFGDDGRKEYANALASFVLNVI